MKREANLQSRVVTSPRIDMSLHLVSRLLGPEVAKFTAHQMEYRWREGN